MFGAWAAVGKCTSSKRSPAETKWVTCMARSFPAAPADSSSVGAARRCRLAGASLTGALSLAGRAAGVVEGEQYPGGQGQRDGEHGAADRHGGAGDGEIGRA